MFNIQMPVRMLWLAVALSACSDAGNTTQEKLRPMVYEGMSATNLKNVIGIPDQIDSSGTVFDANSGKTEKVEKWFYDKRTVVIINDTVIVPNFDTPD